MSISKPNLVRLLAAVVAAAGLAWFVVLYTRFSRYRFEFEHQGGLLMNMTTEMSAHGHWLFALPVLAFAFGIWLLVARPTAVAVFEAVLSVTWLLAFALALFCILSWQIQNLPTLRQMRWQY